MIHVRPEDRPLHDDVRALANALGQVLRRLEGAACFEAVEDLRRACRARRRGESEASDLGALLAKVDTLPLATASVVARAFTLFFLLINTAEQVHRVRRRRAHGGPETPQPASARWALERLRDRGHSADEVARALASLEVRPVLTAHPTESTRRTVLELQARIGEILLAKDTASANERRGLVRALETEVELLWLTSEVRRDRPSVLDEVSNVLWYLEDRLLPASARVVDAFESAFDEVFGERRVFPAPLRLGSWVGGDRDGNPFVSPEITVTAARRAAYTVLGAYARAVRELVRRLSLSARIARTTEALRASIERDRALLPAVWNANQRRDADEPLRLKLTFVAARLEQTMKRVAARDAGHVDELPAAYADGRQFAEDLELIRAELEAAGADRTKRALLEPLLRDVEMFGFFGLRLDARDDSSVHTAALDDIAARIGVPALASTSESPSASLRAELAGRRPLVGAQTPRDERTEKTLAVFRALRSIQDELGEPAASTYIVSMTHSADDLLRVLLLAREEGLVDLATDPPASRLDVVPLFETHQDLVRAPGVMRELLADPTWKRQLVARRNKQEVMIGYSDSAKDVGILPAAWALYRAQEELGTVFRDAGVELTLFHGQGGTVGRGGGSPVYRALMALPVRRGPGGLKITEQGEVISQKFGLLPLAERSLEVLTSGALVAQFEDWRTALAPGEEARFRETMDRLSALALPVFRSRAHDDPALFRMFLEVTPVRELARVHFGSRPTYREKGSGTIQGIRAIPWQFGWTQIRLMLPAWLGVGTALDTVAREPRGLEILRRMARAWPFFDDLLGKLEMVCMKTDLEIARAYVEALGGDVALAASLEAEHARTVDTIRNIRGAELLADNPVLSASIALRNPYVDPLSFLQISLMRRKRSPRDGDDLELLDEALGTTLNGIAQGLRNTG